jgi:hypothetical protein
MNCLLFLPGYLFILFNDLGAYKLIGHVVLLAVAQVSQINIIIYK